MANNNPIRIFLAALSLAAAFPATARAQEAQPPATIGAAGDTLELRKSAFSMNGYKYAYRGESRDIGIGCSNIKGVLRSDPGAMKDADAATRFKVASYFTAAASGFCLGVGLAFNGQEEGKEDATGYFIAGGAFLAVTLVLDGIGTSRLKRAVGIFNSNRRSPGTGTGM